MTEPATFPAPAATGPTATGPTAAGNTPGTVATPSGAVPAGVGPAALPGPPPVRTQDIVAGPGGVMTDEVGVVTGDLTLRSELADGQLTLRVQYKDSDEWYVVTGGRAPLADPADLDAVHTIAVALLHRPEG